MPCAHVAGFIAEVFIVWKIVASSVLMEGECRLVARRRSRRPGLGPQPPGPLSLLSPTPLPSSVRSSSRTVPFTWNQAPMSPTVVNVSGSVAMLLPPRRMHSRRGKEPWPSKACPWT